MQRELDFRGAPMRNAAARSSFISLAAIGAALVWGVVELLALQCSWFSERLRS